MIYKCYSYRNIRNKNDEESDRYSYEMLKNEVNRLQERKVCCYEYKVKEKQPKVQ